MKSFFGSSNYNIINFPFTFLILIGNSLFEGRIQVFSQSISFVEPRGLKELKKPLVCLTVNMIPQKGHIQGELNIKFKLERYHSEI